MNTLTKTALLGCLTLTSLSVSAHTCKYEQIKSTAPAERFIADEGGTVLDASTGLEWMTCAYGAEFQNGGCSGSPENFTSWGDALMLRDSVNDTGFAGHSDWRLPNIKELASIIEYACFAPAITVDTFPDTPSAGFWSNTPDPGEVNEGLKGRIIDFTYGVEDLNSPETRIYVRLVRESS